MRWIASVPSFAYLFVVYNFLVFSGGDAGGSVLEKELHAFSMLSGSVFAIHAGNVLLMVGVVALYIEIFKATRSATTSILDHLFSMLTFVGFLVEFLVSPKGATEVFFILMLMAFLDVVAGFTVTIVSARRDMSLGSA
ncbi:MAG: hypothetical protein HQL74_09930 [Magnetococcales bacterium]|nr:hypothetical protein [Magnetococcales bacterium]